MPFYTVNHSYPLTSDQKSTLAQEITRLHSTKFLTPSIFVHVKFNAHDASDQTYFIAGKPRVNSTNHITGLVRTSSSRTQEHWEQLSRDIEEAWYTTVSGPKDEEKDGKRKGAANDSQATIEAKQLRLVTFYPMVYVWENGDPIPPAGHEAEWLSEHREKFQAQADAGNELYQELMEEVTSREDLKKAYST